jgi:opacity protein-like surface antigen
VPVSVFASNLPFLSALHLQPVITISGGWANENAAASQSFMGTDDNLFIYNNQQKRNSAGLGGVFLGVQSPVLSSAYSIQSGIEYIQYVNSSVNSTSTSGIEPATSTLYDYHYRIQARQLLLMTKFIANIYKMFSPYICVGVGTAFNSMGQFNVATAETGSINLTPTFNSNTHSTFSYSVGIGVDAPISEHVLFGLSYRFSDLGKAVLGDGTIKFNNYQFSVPFTLNVAHVYSNQIVAQLSYLF